jgi:uncharacterized protein (TIGR04255 family)
MSDASESFPRPEYPNSPLQRVVFEIRFPGEPSIECHRDDFFSVVREEFPRVLVPKLQPGAAAALSPYHFQRIDETASLLTALNLFAYLTSTYPGFAKFKHEVLKWVGEFGKRFNLDGLTRTGLRYTNIIPYAPGEAFPVTNFLNVGVTLGAVESSRFSQFSLSAVIPIASGRMLTVQVQEDEALSAIVLDFDFAILGDDLKIADVERYLDDSHRETKLLFEGLLTSGYRSFLRGEGLV